MTRYLMPCLAAVIAAGCANESSLDRLPRAPDIAIVAPEMDEVFRRGEGAIELVGTVEDNLDSPDRLDVTWTVDEDDPFAADVSDDGDVGGSLDPDELALGFHDLVLTATDRDDATAIATVRFEVQGPLGSPEVTITAPEDGSAFESTDAVTFTGEATDETTPAAELVFAWDSSLDGALEGAVSADGSSVLVANGLSAGTHVVTLVVTDGDGEPGVDQIEVQIVDP